ncbi:MAG: BREX system P-loop protein BrxC, partial [Thermodesulfobacteriota bacterium]|nr:BREX system P-loop protein BrxC [Thermodesulfobacteriota bacterium]
IGPRSEDRAIIVDDYPLLPVRRRFWEHVLRAIDIPGTASQVRTQLRIVYDAVKEMAEKNLGTVMPADFIFDQLQPDLLRTGVLLREIDETIRNLDDGTPGGKLAKRICGLVFLIRKLPREEVADIGVRATAETLADLLISDLSNDGATLRKEIPQILDKLVDEGKLIKIDEEYSLQTRESSEWDREFRNRQTRLNNELTALAGKRSSLLNAACSTALNGIKLLQGKCKTARRLSIHFGAEPPEVKGNEIPVWVRDGWGENESTVLADARAAGTDSPVIHVYVPKASADDLKKAIVEHEAAKATMEFKGTPTTPEGQEARDSMSTRMGSAKTARNTIIQYVINAAKVIQGGGQERFDLSLKDKVNSAAEISLDRLFPNFQDADDDRWHTVINHAKGGSQAALQAVDWNDAPEKHPICSAVLSEIGSGKKGKDVRDIFESTPYGWPRDAIDAALITLFTTGHIRVTHKGVQLKQGQLDQAKISVSDFRVETVTIDARARIKLRKLFQGAGIPCKPNEESIAAGQFLAHLMEVADGAGGELPMPERPSTDHLDNLRALAGNEQLAEILNQYDTLTQQIKDWSALADLAAKRKPTWETLQTLLKHSKTLPASEDLNRQANAVSDERRLLDETDPIPAIHKDAVTALRKAVKRAYDDFKAAYDREMAALEGNDNWNTISPVQQEEILFTEEIADIPDLSIGDDSKLVQSLEETSITNWKTKIDALPKQFSNATVSAARLLEPETQTVKLTSGTLKTETDVKNWIDRTEQKLLEKLGDGPIVIS